LKKMILLIAALLAATCLVGSSVAQTTAAVAPEGTTLTSDSGINITQMNATVISMYEFFGPAAFDIADAVKFTPPSPTWNLDRVEVLGYDGFNGTAETVPKDRVISMEIRDAKLNLLSKWTDSQLPYFNFRNNVTGPLVSLIDVPPVTVNGDFYICFYDRSAVFVGTELENATGNSFIFDRVAKQLVPAALPAGENKTMPVNWVIRAIGH